MEKVKSKLECSFNGYSTKKNGDVDVSFKAPYSELVNCMKLLQMISCNIQCKAKMGASGKPFDLGTFYLTKFNVDRDGETRLTFNTEIESSEIENMINLTEKDQIIYLMCVAELEDDDE